MEKLQIAIGSSAQTRNLQLSASVDRRDAGQRRAQLCSVCSAVRSFELPLRLPPLGTRGFHALLARAGEPDNARSSVTTGTDGHQLVALERTDGATRRRSVHHHHGR